MKDMHPDLEWLARNVNEWPMTPLRGSHSIGWNGLGREGQEPDFIRRSDPFSDEYTKPQWLQARKDLGLDQPEVTDAEEEEWQRMEWSKQITDTDDEAQVLEDMVNHPPHYQSDNGIECIDAIRAALGLDGFVAHCRGTAIKYCWRSGKKQAHAEDLRKAAWYLNEAAAALEE